MKILLDTHALIWFVDDNPQLSPAARAAVEDPSNQKFVSMATCWEMSIKAGLKKLGLTEPVSVYLARELPANNFDLFEISLAHATAVEHLPHHHRDPFDRMIVAQALAEGMPVVSADAALDPYGVTRIW